MNSVSKYSLISLAFLLLFPLAVSTAHFFAGHEHVLCHNYSDTHFHKESTDCELFKFHQTTFSSPELFSFNIFNPEIENQKPNSSYWFLSEFEELSFALRGPPVQA